MVVKCREIGIFRLNGSHRLVQDLNVVFAFPQCAIPPAAGVHEVANILSKWLYNLPSPLIPPEIAVRHLLPGEPSSVIEVLHKIPEINRKTLSYIFQIMDAVVSNSEFNKMDFKNISSCFVISLIQSHKNNQPYNFHFFYAYASKLINPAKNDFVLEGPLVDEVLSIPYTKPNQNQNCPKRLTLVSPAANRNSRSSNFAPVNENTLTESPPSEGTR
ncbi:hypothetical protein TRFO_25088 [Tritrichomonas foetus]|uniref:Rho-GAP domain-containing protein n=1 Tax=Tritrichomonas foetus TaxID=1144522 RepID=A0A1J4KAX2_9EUKA|nr:hypothetical protein TRFO_25088 [Tritrichomonas foetus]|eukprot:OHT06838.1 hypothetical protein TRFO_25088 [Tritrichomonas foetus]